MGSMEVPAFMRGLTVDAVLRSGSLRKQVEDYVLNQGYELIFPPEVPRLGDEYLGGGDRWHPVSQTTFEERTFGVHSYLVRRKTEHRRMFDFFFGPRKGV